MRNPRYRFRRLSMVACFTLLSAGPGLAQDMAVPCSAFARTAQGGWKVLAPVMLRIDGRLLGPMVGATFAAGSTTYGIKMNDVLDRECR